MKVSTEIWSTARIEGIGEEKAIELIAKAGFDAWDFSMLVGTENLRNFCEIWRKSWKLGTGSLGNPSVPGLVFIPAIDTSSLSFNSFSSFIFYLLY